MSVLGIPSGAASSLLGRVQSSFGTAATGNYAVLPFYQFDLVERRDSTPSPLLGVTRHNNRDNAKLTQQQPVVTGNAEVPLELVTIGHWLRLCCGNPVTTGSTNFIHTFASGGAAHVMTFEKRLAADNFQQYVDTFARTVRFDLSAEISDDRRVTIGLEASRENQLGASAGGTPAALPVTALQPMTPTTPLTVSWNGVALGRVMGGSLTIDLGVEVDKYVGDAGRVSAVINSGGGAQIEGEIMLRMTTGALDPDALAATERSLSLLFDRGANNRLTIDMPAVVLERRGVPITGPGGLEQTFGFRARQTDAAAMVTFVLRNQVASYTA